MSRRYLIAAFLGLVFFSFAPDTASAQTATVRRVIYVNVTIPIATNSFTDRFINFSPSVNPTKCLAEVVGGPILVGALPANTSPLPSGPPFIENCEASRVLLFTGTIRNALNQVTSANFFYTIRITEFF